jgi:hypothetical protein
MKYPKNRCTSWLIAGLLTAGATAIGADPKGPPAQANNPPVITPPTVKDGSNESRAPFPAARQFDETQGPSAQAREQAPVSTPATENRRPPAPPSNVRIKVQRVPPGENVAQARAKADAEPVLTPTGRSQTAIAASLDSQNFAPTLRAATAASRGKLIGEVESRIASAETALSAVEKSSAEMSESGRKQFKSASDYAKRKAEMLRKSIHAARNASEDDWESARAQLGADYHAYAAALAQIDSVTGVAPPR